MQKNGFKKDLLELPPRKFSHVFIDRSGVLISALDSGQVPKPDFCPGVLDYAVFHMLPYKLVCWADTIAHLILDARFF